MMNKKEVVWHIKALLEYSEWQKEDIKKADKITNFIIEILRNGVLSGTGKPEKLKARQGYSRRIDQYNRLIYDVIDDKLNIMSCKGHYDE